MLVHGEPIQLHDMTLYQALREYPGHPAEPTIICSVALLMVENDQILHATKSHPPNSDNTYFDLPTACFVRDEQETTFLTITQALITTNQLDVTLELRPKAFKLTLLEAAQEAARQHALGVTIKNLRVLTFFDFQYKRPGNHQIVVGLGPSDYTGQVGLTQAQWCAEEPDQGINSRLEPALMQWEWIREHGGPAGIAKLLRTP